MNGNKMAIWALMSTEALSVIHDLRWLLVLELLLIVTDMWYGVRESRMHYHNARMAKNKVRMDQYRFHFSRCGRRTLNKIVDYLTYLLLGTVLGLAILQPYGVSYIIPATLAVAVGGLFEITSIIGHVLVLHHIKLPSCDKKSIAKFLARLAVGVAKTKNAELGNVLDETVEKTFNEEGKNGDKNR